MTATTHDILLLVGIILALLVGAVAVLAAFVRRTTPPAVFDKGRNLPELGARARCRVEPEAHVNRATQHRLPSFQGFDICLNPAALFCFGIHQTTKKGDNAKALYLGLVGLFWYDEPTSRPWYRRWFSVPWSRA